MARNRGRRAEGWASGQHAVIDALFVYGTLRSGQAARSLVANYVAGAQPASARGQIFAMTDGYPALVPGTEGRVVGELCQLRDLIAAFALLDAYEGDDFRRTMLEVELADGRAVWAWTYLLADPRSVDDGELIPSGDWARHLAGD